MALTVKFRENCNSINTIPNLNLKNSNATHIQKQPAKAGENASGISINMQEDKQWDNETVIVNEHRRSERTNTDVPSDRLLRLFS